MHGKTSACFAIDAPGLDVSGFTSAHPEGASVPIPHSADARTMSSSHLSSFEIFPVLVILSRSSDDALVAVCFLVQVSRAS
ncbi:hypothetical protein C6369_003880 [Rhodococcus rhodochrous]|nr:hypothetical protein C6369_003880 [Rhodococcus rhodochrous]